jgi:acyl-coenzyme A synthetase/AMP-(fatty) acid ligase
LETPVLETLWDAVTRHGAAARRVLYDRHGSCTLSALAGGSLFTDLESLRGRCVLIATREQLATAIALVELDGVARRMVLCTPDLSETALTEVAATAQADLIVCGAGEAPGALPLEVRRLAALPLAAPINRRASHATEWILLTSGTTGTPKLVLHTLHSLAGALPRAAPADERRVWSTFYDIRRYGGLQIYLRALLGGSALVLSAADEPPADFLARAGAAGVTHLSGTPSHWRRALMSGAAAAMDPKYVRLSGEVADQPLLDHLRAAYPRARIAHAFASTEAGVAFDVEDGLAGFPVSLLGEGRGGIDMKVEDGTLRIRSSRNAARYLGEGARPLEGGGGYVDTGDLVELVDGRYYFRGRRGGVINVGGLKVFPEEVEAVLNADARVRASLVRGRRNPITGAIVVADVVLADAARAAGNPEAVKSELLDACRRALPAHKVPAMLRLVPSLELTAAGKLVRPGA